MSSDRAVAGLLTRLDLGGEERGPLADLDAVVKDVFDIAGTVTGFGNPDWARLHGPATSDAAVICMLRDAGARIVGKAVTVEFTFGLEGHNRWYGTPPNPAAPDRLPGGSSSGSASAVAAGIVSVGLGSDTGGSVRIPASYCGLFGLRPSYGAISLAGATRYVPSLDVVGWCTQNLRTMRRVADVLLPGSARCEGPVILVRDAFENAETQVASAITTMCDAIAHSGRAVMDLRLCPGELDDLFTIQYTIHGREAWQSLGSWIESHNPSMAEETAARFRAASTISATDACKARQIRDTFRTRIRTLLAGGSVLAFPTSPCVAPRLNSDQAELDAIRRQTQRVTAISGLAGLAELTIPYARVDDLPVGLSLAAAPGRDRALLAFAEEIWGTSLTNPRTQLDSYEASRQEVATS